jgi:hypothetical protein
LKETQILYCSELGKTKLNCVKVKAKFAVEVESMTTDNGKFVTDEEAMTTDGTGKGGNML